MHVTAASVCSCNLNVLTICAALRQAVGYIFLQHFRLQYQGSSFSLLVRRCDSYSGSTLIIEDRSALQ